MEAFGFIKFAVARHAKHPYSLKILQPAGIMLYSANFHCMPGRIWIEPLWTTNPMKCSVNSVFGLAVLASVSLVSCASAVVNIAYVPVGYAGNAADSTGYGAVGYEYKIAKNETAAGVWTSTAKTT